MTEQTSQIATVPDSDYVIFGGTGDLALRKIFPAFFWRFLDGCQTCMHPPWTQSESLVSPPFLSLALR